MIAQSLPLPQGAGRPVVWHRPSFGRDARGSVAVLVALSLSVVLGFTAIALDGANYYTYKRRQQSATDFAALAAAANMSAPQAGVARSAAANGFQSGDVLSIETGQYTADPSLAPAQRFVPRPGAGNAVRVTMLTTPPFIFGRALATMVSMAAAAGPSSGSGSQAATQGFSVRTRAIAFNQDAASFSLGTGVAQLDGGLLNSLLGALLGANVSLSLLDYQNLASSSVDLLSFSDALATRLSLSSSTYDSLLALSVQQSTVFGALQEVTRGTPATTAITALIGQIASRTLPVSPVVVGRILSAGPYGARVAGSVHPLAAKVSALELVSALARLSASDKLIKTTVAVTIPGILAAQLAVKLHEPATTSAMTGIGTQNATLNSAQTRLLLTMQVGNATLGVNLPFYLSLAQGTARLAQLQCSTGSASATVSLGVTPGLVDAAIGNVSDTSLADFSATPTFAPAVLLTVPPLIQVTGLARAAIANMSETAVPFSTSDIQGNVKEVTSTSDVLSSLTSTLFGNLSVQATIAGSTIGVPLGLAQSVTSTILNNQAAIDQLLAGVLNTLGVSVGNATTWVSGVRCGQSTLVN